MRALAALAILASACGDAAIDMRLGLPTAAQSQGFDLSCVSAIRVDVRGYDLGDETHSPDTISKCIDLSTPPKSFGDIQRAMSGQFSFGLPKSGLAGVAIRGSMGACTDPIDHEPVFYGGAPSSGGDSLTIPLIPNISCDKKKTYTTRPIDLLALVDTKTCVTPTDQPFAAAGDFRPQMLGENFSTVLIDWGTEAAPVNGLAAIDSFSGTAATDTCIALLDAGMSSGGGNCVNPSATQLCAQAAGELDVPAISYAVEEPSVDTNLLKQYGGVVFGGVWEASTAATKVPLAGATVELEDPTQGTVLYVSRGTAKLEPISGARGTGTDGLFIAYIKGPPTGLIVKAANHTPQRYVIAATGDLFGNGVPSTLVATLPHM